MSARDCSDPLTRVVASRRYYTDDEDGDEDNDVYSFARHHIDNFPAHTWSQTV